MEIGGFMCVTNAVRRGDTFLEALKSHMLFCNSMTVVDGGSTDGTVEAIQALQDPRIQIITLPWPDDWCWSEFTRHWQIGYEHAQGDWIAIAESDHVFHEKDVERLVADLKKYLSPKYAVADVDKFQHTTYEMAFSKARLPVFMNKRDYGDQICFGLDPNYHTDLTWPLLKTKQTGDYFYEGTAIRDDLTGRTGIRFHNYVWTFKKWDQIFAERTKACRGWNRYKPFLECHNRLLPEGDEEIVAMLKDSMLSKYSKCHRYPLERQPAVMQERLAHDLVAGMYGFDLCGLQVVVE